jgi:hypothetical protein
VTSGNIGNVSHLISSDEESEAGGAQSASRYAGNGNGRGGGGPAYKYAPGMTRRAVGGGGGW